MGVLRKTWHTGLNHELQSSFSPMFKTFFCECPRPFFYVHSPSKGFLANYCLVCLVFTRLETDTEQLEV